MSTAEHKQLIFGLVDEVGNPHRTVRGPIRTYRIANNKVVQTWAMRGRLGLLQQLGAPRT